MKNMEDYSTDYLTGRVYGPRSSMPERPYRQEIKINLEALSEAISENDLAAFMEMFSVDRMEERYQKNQDTLIKVAVEKSIRGLDEKAQQINETRELLRNIQQKQREKEAEKPLQKEAVKKQKENDDPGARAAYQTARREVFMKANETEIAMRALETAMADQHEEDISEQKVGELDNRIDKLETMMINMAMSLSEIKAILSEPPVEKKPVPSGPMVHINEDVLKEVVSGKSLSCVKAVAILTDPGPMVRFHEETISAALSGKNNMPSGPSRSDPDLY